MCRQVLCRQREGPGTATGRTDLGAARRNVDAANPGQPTSAPWTSSDSGSGKEDDFIFSKGANDYKGEAERPFIAFAADDDDEALLRPTTLPSSLLSSLQTYHRTCNIAASIRTSLFHLFSPLETYTATQKTKDATHTKRSRVRGWRRESQRKRDTTIAKKGGGRPKP